MSAPTRWDRLVWWVRERARELGCKAFGHFTPDDERIDGVPWCTRCMREVPE